MKLLWFFVFDDLRQFCIENDFYTAGNNKEYEAMLKRGVSKDGLTAEEVADLAKDITAHTSTDNEYATPGRICTALLNRGYIDIDR